MTGSSDLARTIDHVAIDLTGTSATTPRSGHAWDETAPPPAANAPAPAVRWLERTPVPLRPKSRVRAMRSPSPAQLSLLGPLVPGSVPDPLGSRSEGHAGGSPQPAGHADPRSTGNRGLESPPLAALDPITDAGQPVPARRLPPHQLAPGHHVPSGSPLVAALAGAILEAHAKQSGLWGATHGKVPDASEPDAPARAHIRGRSSGAEERGLRVVGAGRR